MAMFKDEEFTVGYADKHKITIEAIVREFEDGKIPEGARVIALDSDGLVFEWQVKLTPEEEEEERLRLRKEQEEKDAEEADDRKMGF